MPRISRTLLLLLNLPALLAASANPVIKSGTVEFPESGKVLQVPAATEVHADPNVALARGEPVRITRDVLVLDNAKRLIVIETNHYYEGITKRPLIYDYSGSPVHFHKGYRGPLFFDFTGTVFFSCEQSIHADRNFKVRFQHAR